MRVMMMLANHVEVHNGLFYIHGGGWTFTGPDPTTMAIALHIEVPWDQTNIEHHWRLELVDADGQPLMGEVDGEEKPLVHFENSFEVGRPPGVKAGTPVEIPLAFNFVGLPVPPGGRYRFQLWIDDETDENWQAAFSTRPMPRAA